MIYSSQRAQAITKKDIAYLGAGIHDNIKLDTIRVDKSINGKNFIEFKFVAEDGRFATHTEYEPVKSGDQTDEALQVKCDNQFSRIDQILECFYPNPEDRVFNGEGFKAFTDWVADMLNKADKTILLRVKIVYNDNGYTTLPKYAKYRFIEPMSTVNENKSVIVKLNIDKFEKPIVADTEKSTKNPLAGDAFSRNTSSDENTANPNGLPF